MSAKFAAHVEALHPLYLELIEGEMYGHRRLPLGMPKMGVYVQ